MKKLLTRLLNWLEKRPSRSVRIEIRKDGLYYFRWYPNIKELRCFAPSHEVRFNSEAGIKACFAGLEADARNALTKAKQL